jgi:glycerophosphoryl diester phosphodiesterase
MSILEGASRRSGSDDAPLTGPWRKYSPMQARPVYKGVALKGPKGPIRIKWHRLRRTAGDVDFTATRLREGLAAGASMEIDLRRHAERGFVCLHDDVLESETSGEGPIAAASIAHLRSLRMRGPDGAITDEPLLLLDDLIEIARNGHANAVVQFDLKEHLVNLDEATIASFAHVVRPNAGRFLLSGDDWDAVRAIGRRIGGLSLGFDPSELPEATNLKNGRDFADFTRFTLETAAEAAIIYLDYRIVLASLTSGYDMIAGLQGGGKEVDAWTFDITSPDSSANLAQLIASGVDQISSNDPLALQEAAERLGR